MREHRTMKMRKCQRMKFFVHHFRLPRRGEEMAHFLFFLCFCIEKTKPMAKAIGFLLEILHKKREIELTNAARTGIMIVHNAHRRSIAIFTTFYGQYTTGADRMQVGTQTFRQRNLAYHFYYMEPMKKGCDESIWQ